MISLAVVTLPGTKEIVVMLGVREEIPFVGSLIRIPNGNEYSFPGPIVVGDLNSDGFIDIVVCALLSESVDGFDIFFNDQSNGHFTLVPMNFDATVATIIAVAIGDFDNDGAPDDFSGIGSDNSLWTVFAVSYSDPSAYQIRTTEVYSHPTSLIRGRFNDDSLDDLALISPSVGVLHILLAYGEGNFTQFIYATDLYPTSVARINFNNDLIDDLVVLHCNRSVTMFVGSKLGIFHKISDQFQISDGNDGKCARSLSVADFNNDGTDDVAFIDEETENVRILIGTSCNEQL